MLNVLAMMGLSSLQTLNTERYSSTINLPKRNNTFHHIRAKHKKKESSQCSDVVENSDIARQGRR